MASGGKSTGTAFGAQRVSLTTLSLSRWGTGLAFPRHTLLHTCLGPVVDAAQPRLLKTLRATVLCKRCHLNLHSKPHSKLQTARQSSALPRNSTFLTTPNLFAVLVTAQRHIPELVTAQHQDPLYTSGARLGLHVELERRPFLMAWVDTCDKAQLLQVVFSHNIELLCCALCSSGW